MRDGRIVIKDRGTIAPNMSRDAFSTAFADASLVSESNEYSTYTIPSAIVGGREFDVVATLRNDMLFLVRLVDGRIGAAGWAGLSNDLLSMIMSENDAWLADVAGQQRRFQWGTLESVVDPKTGIPEVVVRYTPSGA